MKVVIDILNKYILETPLFASFDYGLDIELNLNGDKIYPQMFLEEPFGMTLDEQDYFNYSFAVWMLDKEEHDINYKENTEKIEKFIQNVREFTDYLDNNGFLVSKPLDFITVRDFSGDVCRGLRLDMTVKYLKKC